jgi:glycosyltransferase involved in cell wall biosynthesis
MRVAITVDPYVPVPPRLYGGIERVADIVVRGLSERGHRVTLFAHPESCTAGRLIPYGAPPHSGWRPRLTELWQVGNALWRRRRELDVVFSWGRLAALLPILPYRGLPKIQRYCRNLVPWRGVRTAVRIAGSSIRFAGASASVYDERPAQGKYGGRWSTVYDGVETSKYTFVPRVPRDAPLVFLGRIERVKGAHSAIAIAREAGRKLVIAGNRSTQGEEAAYFEQEIAPHLDGNAIRYVGRVDDAQKNQLLGSASALLFPVQWKEAFGIVMAEAFACGTPVIGFPCGSVPEVIKEGVNGFVCRGVSEAVCAVGDLDRIDRTATRADCEARFSAKALVDAVERLLVEVVSPRGA